MLKVESGKSVTHSSPPKSKIMDGVSCSALMKTINKKIIADLLISLGCIFAWTIVFAYINSSYAGPVLLVIRLFSEQNYLPGMFVIMTEIIGLFNLAMLVNSERRE